MTALSSMPSLVDLPSHFVIHQPLGEGGMSHLWLAEDERLKRLVAIKVLQSGVQNLAALNEARLLARLNHPNVVQIYEAIPTEQGMVLVMEYIEGVNLARYLDLNTVTWHKAVYWLEQIAWGLQAAHQEGVIHADIKASNIMLLREEQPKLIDFGIGQPQGERSEASSDTGFATLSHRAPEILHKGVPTVASDLFALGCVAYELLSGNKVTLKSSQIPNKLTPISTLKPELPNALIMLIDQLLASDPNERPASAAEVAERLRVLLKDEFHDADEETQPLIEEKQESSLIKKALLKPILAISLVISLVIGTVVYWQALPPEARYVAVLPPEWVGEKDAALLDKDTILAAIYSAQRQMIVDAESLHAIPESDVRFTQKRLKPKNSAELAGELGVDALVQTEVSCVEDYCELKVELLEKNKEKRWHSAGISLKKIIANTYHQIFDVSAGQLASFFPYLKFRDVHFSKMSNEDYLVYFNLERMIYDERQFLESYRQKIERLQNKYPGFYPLYDLFRFLMLALYEDTKAEKWLNNLSDFLERSPSGYRLSLGYLVNKFYVEVKRKSWSTAKLSLKEIRLKSNDELLYGHLVTFLFEKQGFSHKATEQKEKIYRLKPSFNNGVFFARSLIVSGQIIESIEVLEELNEKHSDNVFVKGMLALAYLQKGEIKESLSLYKALLEKNYTLRNRNHFAVALMLDGQYGLANDFFYKLCSEHPTNSMYCLNYSDNLWLMGNKDRALSEYNKLIDAHSESDDGYVWLDLAQAYAHVDRPILAVKSLNKAKLLKVKESDFYFSSALVNSIVGDQTSAIVNLQSATNLGYGDIWFSLPWFKPLCDLNALASSLSKEAVAKLCEGT